MQFAWYHLERFFLVVQLPDQLVPQILWNWNIDLKLNLHFPWAWSPGAKSQIGKKSTVNGWRVKSWKISGRWTKSCTSWYGKYPMFHRVLYIPGGAGFLPSTVCFESIYSPESRIFHHGEGLHPTNFWEAFSMQLPPAFSSKTLGRITYPLPTLAPTWVDDFPFPGGSLPPPSLYLEDHPSK